MIYLYFVSYVWTDGGSYNVSQSTVEMKKPITTGKDIKELVENFEDFHAADKCIILNYKLMSRNTIFKKKE